MTIQPKTPAQECKEIIVNMKLLTLQWICERRIRQDQEKIDRIDAYLAAN